MNAKAQGAAAADRSLNSAPYDVERIRADFPILSRLVHGKPLVFLDTAASAQKPRPVLEAMRRCYEEEYANVHRGVYYLSERATQEFEAARSKVRAFLGAAEDREIIFTKGATDAINLVAASHGDRFLQPGDEIILSALEHHSNIVPWQLLRDRRGIVIKVVPVDDSGAFRFDAYEKLLSRRTRLVAVTHVANSIGSINPVPEIIRAAHAAGALVLIDGCQAVPHQRIDVRDLDADFYVFSGHKLYGPTGIGALYGKAALLEAMPPYQGGGDMIRSVTFEKTEYAAIPSKFEAGTPNIAGAIGLGAAVDYVEAIGIGAIERHEKALLAYGTERLGEIDGLRLIGTAPHKAGILSFTLAGAHPHDIGTILDRSGIAVRAGHHCAQPVMDRFGVAGTARASLGLYTRFDEIDALADGLAKVKEIFG
jgi:cysteine desulfurase / selenocysteine lyase